MAAAQAGGRRGGGEDGSGEDGGVHAEEGVAGAPDDAEGAREAGEVEEHGAGEGVEDADGGLALVEQDEEAGAEGDDPAAAEAEAHAEAAARGGLEEGDLIGVVRARRVAVAERGPADRGVVAPWRWPPRRGETVLARQSEQAARRAM
jgi:hypothetical protein